MAPYEVLVQATISDLYFVHQRGTRIAVWNLFLLTGICGAGFISGYIIEFLGYQWVWLRLFWRANLGTSSADGTRPLVYAPSFSASSALASFYACRRPRTFAPGRKARFQFLTQKMKRKPLMSSTEKIWVL